MGLSLPPWISSYLNWGFYYWTWRQSKKGVTSPPQLKSHSIASGTIPLFLINAILAWRSSKPISWIWRIALWSTCADCAWEGFSYSNGASILLSKLSIIQFRAASILSFVAVNALILAFREYPIPYNIAKLSYEYYFFFSYFICSPWTF